MTKPAEAGCVRQPDLSGFVVFATRFIVWRWEEWWSDGGSAPLALYYSIRYKGSMKTVELNEIVFGGSRLVLIAGPCVIEEEPSITFRTAEKLQEITAKLQIPYLFKSSFDKANRSSIRSFRGIGVEKGLKRLMEVKERFSLPVVTDIHTPDEAQRVAEVADVLQIPAFLCRQTDLLVAAAKTGKVVNIKKGQFLAPRDMEHCARKVIDSGNERVLITERGSSFGYGNLVSDMRGIPIVQGLGYPVIFDATHSVQLPGGAGSTSSGERQFVGTLAKSAVAAGANGLFLEVHPDPGNAPCDGPNMLTPQATEELLKVCRDVFEAVH